MANETDRQRLKSGWGVLRLSPWHLAGVYETSGEAEAKVAALGNGYVIRYGDRVAGTDEFISVGVNGA